MLVDYLEDGREFESLLRDDRRELNVSAELRVALAEITRLRQRPTVCYLSNIFNSGIKASRSIDYSDDLPFSEMIGCADATSKSIDVVVVTPGGSAEQVTRFVDCLRARFNHVTFILPNAAMSAGTILALSGNEVIMDERGYIGPIDPQVPNAKGMFVPAQSLLTLIKSIQERGAALLKTGQQPDWTDLQILRHVDARDIGNALNASNYSVELVESYLVNYKFHDWTTHSSDGRPVTEEDKKVRAREIATLLCDHSLWKTHSRGITRDLAWSECRIRVTHPEDIEGLHRALRRFWAIAYYVFDKTSIFKLFLSDNYCIIRTQLNRGLPGQEHG